MNKHTDKVEYEHKVLSGRLMATRSRVVYDPPKPPLGCWSSWRIRDNIFETIKAYVIWHNKPSHSSYLPYFVPEINDDEFPDLTLWRWACDGLPDDVVMGLDFSKPYDKAKADGLRAKHIKSEKPKKPTVDADLIIQGELGELDEK